MSLLERQEQAEETKRQERDLRAILKAKDAEMAELRRLLDFTTAIDQAKLRPAKWLTPSRPGKNAPAIACITLNDTHFDEVVNVKEMEGYNAYDRQIAELRLRRWVTQTISLARDHIAGVEWAGLTVFAGGDLFSGDIHEELTETNADSLYGSVIHWIDLVESAILALADHFGRVHIATTVGNHGRNSRKPRAKGRVRNNIEWLFWRVVQRSLASDSRITWDIPEAFDTFVKVYGTRYKLTHGDQFRGGSGISGVLTPLMLGSYRKGRKSQSMGAPFDVLVLGHFHQYLTLPGLIMGGTSKGYDEYASSINVTPAPPSQAFWLTDPEWGVTIQAPIHVGDRKAEGW